MKMAVIVGILTDSKLKQDIEASYCAAPLSGHVSTVSPSVLIT